jgi:hypothetical protein
MVVSRPHDGPIVTDEERRALLGNRPASAPAGAPAGVSAGALPGGPAPAEGSEALRDALAPLVAEVTALRETLSSLRDQVAFLTRGIETLCREVERRHDDA